GVAARPREPHRKAPVNDPARPVQHLSEHHFPGLLGGKGTAASRPEHPPAQGEA
ncbi:MarR family transcriptional regulator, partial [Dysosmobacter welbionis]